MEFYGYKKCSTCRNAHKNLSNHGIHVEFRDFVDTPPSVETLRRWVELKGEGIWPFINTKGTRFRELGLKDKVVSEEEWLTMLSQDGKLIKRPILITDKQVMIGFDERVYDALSAE